MYLSVPESEMNEKLKRKIAELESLGEQLGKVLQRKYASVFESQGKQNLGIWVCRDIDGDENEISTTEQCFEKEYRSQIVIDFDGPKFEGDDFYAYYIELWYYFGGYIRGSGTLYDLSNNDLETEIEEGLKILLK
ncbi:hypothetical protein BK139_05065 [Paenibacillus sp. FSL R5-0490]|uniref:hypothetical protein n=1 Tax=Bacillales TaxID=1385 RepID=UPI00096D3119|nr:hypothetical protein [Paenibacillus sp. FSL R5-0490]OMF61888.1 hypothetical protein BK139_05065 [Paenibacillus sp. FSL R5-0490]